MRKKGPKRLKFAKPDTKGIPLSELMAVHRQFKPKGSLSDNIGDGFLLATNPVYRSIRNEYLARGFSYSLNDTHNYYAFPLMSLDDAIERGAIPYRKNFPWLEKLEKLAPGKFTLTELKKSELQFNYLFHESAHFIAHSVLFGKKAPRLVPKNAESLLKILIGEAMANTVECVSAIFTEGEIGTYFLDANCHFRTNEKEARALTRVAQKVGLRRLTKAVMASFLYANYMYERVGQKEKNLIADIAEVDSVGLIAPAIRVGFELSDIFRTNTTHLHLMKMGFPGDLQKLIQFDPLKKLLGNKKLLGQFNQLVEIIVHELKVQSTSK
ncbi:MAG: hypothetical protein ACXWQO_08930 [Bdellovibrionota bacterium]